MWHESFNFFDIICIACFLYFTFPSVFCITKQLLKVLWKIVGFSPEQLGQLAQLFAAVFSHIELTYSYRLIEEFCQRSRFRVDIRLRAV